ncbi:MAG: hypothetical protein RL017_568 [Pseudomonadota bacterium]|jgi:ADP-ribose pyrophosphatase
MSNQIQLVEETVESKVLMQGSFMTLMQDRVKLPDGKFGVREYLKHQGAVAIIALTTDNQIVIEKQYRHPVKQIMLEIPAGKLETNEDLLLAAQRELQEETGFHSNTWIKLGKSLPCIGYSSEEITYFLALDVIAGVAHLDEGEFLETHTLPFSEFLDMIYSGEISDAKTITGIMFYLGYLRKQTTNATIK